MSDLPNVKLEKLARITKETKVCNDFYIGAVRVLNKEYLPQWGGETKEGYAERLATTSFANMFAPVVDAIAGLVTKKEPNAQGYENIDIKNIDLEHNNLAGFMKQTIKKSIISGVSFVSAETSKELNRAYLKRYDYKDLYSYLIKDGILQQIVFKEIVEVADGTFGLLKQERYTVFKIGGGAVWYADTDASDASFKERSTWENKLKEIPILPIITGKILSPFEIVPKLLDIAILNKVHLNLESNLANVLGVVGSPVAVFYGQTSENAVTIGVKDALVFTDKSKEGFEYVEIKGESIGSLESKIASTEKQIDKLSFSMLVNQDSTTVIDAEENKSKNTSFLSDIAFEAEVKFAKLLEYMAELENKTLSTDAKLELHKDFDAVMMDLETAFKMLQAGDMSRETFYDIYKNGKLPKDFNIENENEKIEKDLVG